MIYKDTNFLRTNLGGNKKPLSSGVLLLYIIIKLLSYSNFLNSNCIISIDVYKVNTIA
jgi:hypothetical protein